MRRLLRLSLLVNVVLVALALRPRFREAPMPRALRAQVGAPAARRVARITEFRPGQTASPTRWSGIESRDPRQLMANLRAIGCPEQTILDLVVFRVCRDYRTRLLGEAAATARSWDFTKNQAPAEWRERHARQRELRDQMYAELDALLGRSFGNYGVGVAFLGFGNETPDFLPLEKRKLVRETESRFRRLSEPLESERAMGLLDTEGSARLRELTRQQQAELAQSLSPEEAEEYLYRESPAARYVRERMPQAKSEAEFRAIVRIAAELGLDPSIGNDFAARFGQEPADPALARAEADRQAEFQRRLKESLGEARLAEQEAQEKEEAERQRIQEQQRQEQQERARFMAMAEDLGIEAAAADRLLDRLKELQPTLESRFNELEKTLSGTPEEKQKQMEVAVRAVLEQHAAEFMGEKGHDFIQKLAGERP